MNLSGQIRTSRKRAWRACQHCHSRKVRCDGVVNGFPCTNCRLDNYDCAPLPGPRNGALVKKSERSTLNDEGAHAVRRLQHNFKKHRYRRCRDESNTKSNCGMSDVVFKYYSVAQLNCVYQEMFFPSFHYLFPSTLSSKPPD